VQEIAILVNMVKAGKTVNDVNSSRNGTGFDISNSLGSSMQSPLQQTGYGGGGFGNSSRANESKEQDWEHRDRERSSKEAKEARAKQFAAQQRADREAQLERERADKMLKRHLFGVPPPTDEVSVTHRRHVVVCIP
jgi:hypothetical protein